MSQIEAIYRQGVFEPLDKVDLPENQRVRLCFDATPADTLPSWLREVQRLQGQVIRRQGHLPDSTPDLATDRLR